MSEIRYGSNSRNSRNDAPQLLRCVVVAMMSLLLLSGCQRYQDVPQCSEAISEGFTGYFKLDDNGLAVDQVTGNHLVPLQCGSALSRRAVRRTAFAIGAGRCSRVCRGVLSRLWPEVASTHTG